MSKFEFVKHERFIDDKYIKEIVYILVNGCRHAFVHKVMQNGGSYWDVLSTTVTNQGEKETYKAAYFQDSFVMDDIKDYLKKRKWENGYQAAPSVQERPTSMSEVAENDQLPF
jgi:hypothetical protein